MTCFQQLPPLPHTTGSHLSLRRQDLEKFAYQRSLIFKLKSFHWFCREFRQFWLARVYCFYIISLSKASGNTFED